MVMLLSGKSMMNLLRLIRWKNLVIIAFTMYVMHNCVMYSMLHISEFELQLNGFYFFLLCLSVLFIAAAGYIINDYFDTGIDTVNKTDKVIIGNSISKDTAMKFHLAFNFLGIALGYYIGYRSGLTKLGFIHLISAGLLWYYSSDFKKQFLVGNIIVSILPAFVPLIPGLYEMPLLYVKYSKILEEAGANFNFIAYFLLTYSAFAFGISLIREIVKDIEDCIGDKEFGRNTLPVSLGVATTKWIVAVLILGLMLGIGYFQQKQYGANDKASFYYLLFLLQIPFGYILYKLIKSQQEKEYAFISTLLKITMMLGISYSFLFSYLLLH